MAIACQFGYVAAHGPPNSTRAALLEAQRRRRVRNSIAARNIGRGPTPTSPPVSVRTQKLKMEQENPRGQNIHTAVSYRYSGWRTYLGGT
jgi:hypothetical protein